MSELWKELHTRAITNTGASDAEYLASFRRRIPRYTTGCACQEFWINWIRACPPSYGPNNEYFNWTVKAHNAVNMKLGKPQISLEDAFKLYSPTTDPIINPV